MNPRSWAEVGWGPRREADSAVGPLKPNTKVKFKKHDEAVSQWNIDELIFK